MVIITGATSFVGRRLAPMALKYFDRSEILCLAWKKDNPTGLANRKILEKAKLTIKKVDLVTKEGLNDLPKSPNIVIHLAANTDTSDTNHRVNYEGTKNLIKSLGKLGPETHLIYTSTTVFYGGRTDCSKPLDESSTITPTNEYGRTKLRAEQFLRKHCQQHGYRLTILRLGTVYGKNSRPKSLFKLIPEKIKEGSILTRLNWPGLTSIIHVDDVAKALLLFATKKLPKPGKPEIYILSAESLSLAQISAELHKALEIKYRPIKLPTFFWKTAAYSRRFVPYLEKILPASLYNYFWRASLIVDNAVWCENNKALKALPGWHPRLLKNCVKEIVEK